MSDSILDISVNEDIYDIYQRNDDISINIYNGRFTLNVGGYVKSIQPYEILKFVKDVKTIESNLIQLIPNNPIQFGNINGVILNEQIRTYTFKWNRNTLIRVFDNPRYIHKDFNIHEMSGSSLKDNSYLKDSEEMKDKDFSLYYEIYGDVEVNPVLPVDNSNNIYSCKMFQPEFLLIHNGNISSGGFINDVGYDYKLHVFKNKTQFEDITLIPEATNTYSSGKLCIQSTDTILSAINNYYNDTYNTDLSQKYFNEMVYLQYRFANMNSTNTLEFFDILKDDLDIRRSINLKSIIQLMLS